MSKFNKLVQKILLATSDKNIDFDDLVKLLNSLNFAVRIKGSHYIFSRPDVEEIINIQPIGSKAKVYQVKQVREIIVKYKLFNDYEAEI